MPSARRADHQSPGADRRRAELDRRLVRAFPELRAALDGMTMLWDGETPGPHRVYADLFVRQVLLGRAQEPGGGAVLRRAARFLEEIVASPEGDLAAVARYSVLENLLLEGGPAARARVLGAAGPGTRRLAREVAGWWGVPLPRASLALVPSGAGPVGGDRTPAPHAVTEPPDP
jgi:hypothetical protein